MKDPGGRQGWDRAFYTAWAAAAAGLVLVVVRAGRMPSAPRRETAVYAGSLSCRDCHERFYELWAPSHHGRAMQPVTAEFVTAELTPPTNALTLGDRSFSVDLAGRRLLEDGPQGQTAYPLLHALGGKNVYYLLTPLERGRQQVIPLAYDVRSKEWFDATGSMIRHFSDAGDAPLEWRDPLLTFNTACHGCHVSQLSKNYDPATDSYRTVWQEPGINCETCHGPGSEHIRVCRQSPEGVVPADLKIISTKSLTPRQRDDTCAPCHAKMRPLTDRFTPGERYFDHYDLVTFEDRDYYADGRDRGENYTYTLWLTSPCVKSGRLECLHCHTSSGRFRFKGEKANEGCLPCHRQRVENAVLHTRHAPDSEGNRCIACHMPMTTFARMRRSDHSMRPPAPAATLAFGSPNACTPCHTDQTVEWADRTVREWRKRDYQAPVLQRGGLIRAARKRDWTRLDEMLAVIGEEAGDAVFVTSLLRLMGACEDARKWPAVRKALGHASPLVRSAAARELIGDPDSRTPDLLLAAAKDDYRVVRAAAASSLVRYPDSAFTHAERASRDAAFEELKSTWLCQPDSWSANYNLGNFYTDRGLLREGLAAYELAMRLRPDVVQPLVNAALARARLGDVAAGMELLKKAVVIAPLDAAVNFNLGLALAELGRVEEAESHLRRACKADPGMADAAHNLGVLLNRDAVCEEGLEWCRKAVKLQPLAAKYVYSLAFYLRAGQRAGEAAAVLEEALSRGVVDGAVYTLLGQMAEESGKPEAALAVYRRAEDDRRLDAPSRRMAAARAEALARP